MMQRPNEILLKARAPWALRWHWSWVVGALILLVVANVHSGGLRVGLLSDDWNLVSPQPTAHIWASWTGHWIGGGAGTFYRPLSRVLLYYQGRAFGYEGMAYHVVSLGLYLGCTVLVGLLAGRVGGRVCALVAMALFGLCPHHTEVVTWVSCQSDLLALLFLLLAVASVVVGQRSNAPVSLRRWVASLGFGVLCYLSKDSSVVLGPLAVVLTAGVLLTPPGDARGRWRNAAWHRVVLIGASHVVLWLMYLLVRKIALGSVFPEIGDRAAMPHGALWHYGRNLYAVVEETMVLFVPWLGADGVLKPGSPVAWVVLLWVAGVWVLWFSRRRAAAVVLAATMVTLLPAVTASHGFFHVSMMGHRRYLFMSSVGLAMLVGLLCAGRRPAVDGDEHAESRMGNGPLFGLWALALAIVLIAFSAHTVSRVQRWQYTAQVRDEIGRQIGEVAKLGKPVLLNVLDIPSHNAEAYLFRNGFDEYLRVMYPNVRSVRVPVGQPIPARADEAVYTFKYVGEGQPALTPARAL